MTLPFNRTCTQVLLPVQVVCDPRTAIPVCLRPTSTLIRQIPTAALIGNWHVGLSAIPINNNPETAISFYSPAAFIPLS